jgi:hypothetical protein
MPLPSTIANDSETSTMLSSTIRVVAGVSRRRAAAPRALARVTPVAPVATVSSLSTASVARVVPLTAVRSSKRVNTSTPVRWMATTKEAVRSGPSTVVIISFIYY